MSGRVPNSEHETHPWVIEEIAPDFELLDAWDLSVEGGRDDFDSFLEVMTSLDPADAGAASRLLFWVRYRIGDVLGLDDPTKEHRIPGSADTTLRARLPENLRGSAEGLGMGDALKGAGAAFVPVYRTDQEWAAEIANDTVHGVLHLAWVDEGSGRFRGRLAVYVKPHGALGRAYMMLIGPFRHLVVYPALMRQIRRAWNERVTAGTTPAR